ncbi:aldehyde ferredoxin oxidoreductase [Desulfosarcina ovata subsp. sediminis]|uniref:Aldehyde ferredoxin oxidoreductase n=1 Tax=Desulfosarcina ovata subsp. sediminis TaxID=885957 RepID=A0A5K7ZKX5_9BACT|nr:aldehyde ferredoxin oxidoreductase C-terminal domain-containing protein [Desulfosarcina ovata]BBO81696.1 aldehyde ferredoxin oxidoreductase [Desulfosarcina ovata subsp. sediminis]
MQQIIRIDMSTLSVSRETLPAEYAGLGGRGLTSRIISREVPPNCHPLGVDNKIVFAPGLLTGTHAPSSGRLSVGAKSPLTGGIKESNVGGTAGVSMARMGIGALIVEGAADAAYVLEVSGDDIRFRSAGELKNQSNYAVGRHLADRYGPKTPYIAVGPAGEAGLAVATVAVSDLEGRPTRHAGRGGMGAVLGAKGVRAIVFPGKGSARQPEDAVRFKAAAKGLAKELADGRKALTRYGTAVLVNVINAAGALPVNNFRHGSLAGTDAISGETLARHCDSRGGRTGHPCHPGCVIRCSNIYHAADGNYLTSALEYETITLLGTNCGLRDLDQIAELDFMCDDFGMDTMETGTALAVAMEAGLLPWGDFEGMKRCLAEMVDGTVLGRLLGQGAHTLGRTLGVTRIPTVKGQAIAGYDPRVLKGTGATYATSPMGGDHTAGNCLPGRTGLNDREKTGQVSASREIQTYTTLFDNLGLCIFVGPVKGSMAAVCELFNSYTGLAYGEAELNALAEEILQDELIFNEKAGISRYQNDLPAFFRTEAVHSGLVFDVPPDELVNAFDH